MKSCEVKPGDGWSYPFSSGTTLPTALAAPVEAGMMFWEAPRPSLHSLPEGPSTVFCVAVTAWTVLWRSEKKVELKDQTVTMTSCLLGNNVLMISQKELIWEYNLYLAIIQFGLFNVRINKK